MSPHTICLPTPSFHQPASQPVHQTDPSRGKPMKSTSQPVNQSVNQPNSTNLSVSPPTSQPATQLVSKPASQPASPAHQSRDGRPGAPPTKENQSSNSPSPTSAGRGSFHYPQVSRSSHTTNFLGVTRKFFPWSRSSHLPTSTQAAPPGN